MKKYKYTFIILTIIFSLLLITYRTHNSTSITYMQYTVQQGDTIWNIARQYNTYNDIRKTVYEIRKINNSNCIIHQGDVLLIPIKY